MLLDLTNSKMELTRENINEAIRKGFYDEVLITKNQAYEIRKSSREEPIINSFRLKSMPSIKFKVK